MDFSAYTLASSSKGNSIYVRYGEDEILIDAGISCKRLDSALHELDSELNKIKAIFITHEHSDHVSALKVLTKHHTIPIHFTWASAAEYFARCGALSTAVIHPPIFSVEVGKIRIESFTTPHDSAASVGYIITAGENRLAIATDIGIVDSMVENSLLGADYVVLESNHDENMLLCGSYSYDLKRRILSNRGHLSNENAASFAKRLADSGTKRILLAHLSPENNLPELALETAKIMLRDTACSVEVAKALEPTKIV